MIEYFHDNTGMTGYYTNDFDDYGWITALVNTYITTNELNHKISRNLNTKLAKWINILLINIKAETLEVIQMFVTQWFVKSVNQLHDL